MSSIDVCNQEVKALPPSAFKFEIVYVSQKAIKGQALADFLADHPILDEWKFSEDLPDEDVLFIELSEPWKMFFDGAARQNGAGAGVIFITLEGEVLPFSFSLTNCCCNNMAEYQALILGLEMAMNIKMSRLKVFGDSQLVIRQLLSLYEVKKPEFIPYHKHGKLPNDLRHKTEVRRRASRFIYFQGTLYRRSFEGIFLRCLGEEEATKALEETHSGIWLSNEDNVRLRLEELEALDEKRLEAQQRLECYQARLCRAFNKKVRPRSFQEGDLVLAIRRPIIMSKRMGSKFLSKWDGPYVVQEVYTNGAYKIVDENGLRIGPINGKFLKRYYA
ncbi:hypothetical protein DKX38_023663 [Salix brachista]|uniref:RNase H type-1 domain-containing protein n=1 Tax=Salix brachista TaxID=2182728 RepID=A0A5N5JN67_9ROSI|nr:hypothetical protein DKX38_023663 [Salix brachista]